MIEIFQVIKYVTKINLSLLIKENCKYVLNGNFITIFLEQLKLKEQFC